MARHQSHKVGIVLLIVLTASLGACNSRPTDIFPPIIIGEATAAPTVLDTPVLTPTPVITAAPFATVTPVVTLSPRTTPISSTPATPDTTVTPNTTAIPNATTTVPAATRRTTAVATGAVVANATDAETGPIIVRTPRRRQGTPVAVGGTPQVTLRVTMTSTTAATTIFRNYLALIVSQLQRTPTPTTPTLTATPVPGPIVITNTPIPTPTVTDTPEPTATSGTPPATPTPFTGTVRLLERDPVGVKGVIPAVAYTDPDNLLAKDWSTFYARFPENSNFVKIYSSDSSRVYGPALSLTEPNQWLEAVCAAPTTLVGVQFWGDDNDGWARVLVDGEEQWRGNTYGQSPTPFVRFLEISGLESAIHVIRVEPLGRPGTNLAGANDDVSVYAVVCGIAVESEIFIPLLER